MIDKSKKLSGEQSMAVQTETKKHDETESKELFNGDKKNAKQDVSGNLNEIKESIKNLLSNALDQNQINAAIENALKKSMSFNLSEDQIKKIAEVLKQSLEKDFLDDTKNSSKVMKRINELETFISSLSSSELVESKTNEITGEVEKSLNNSTQQIFIYLDEIKRSIKNLPSNDKIQEQIKVSIENVLLENKSFNLSEDQIKEIAQALKNSLGKDFTNNTQESLKIIEKIDELKANINDTISKNIGDAVKKQMTEFSNDKVKNEIIDFSIWTAIYAVLIVVSSIFTSRGYCVIFENIVLLRVAISFVIISVIWIVGFNLIFSFLKLRNNKILLRIYYISTIIISVIAFILSCFVLMG